MLSVSCLDELEGGEKIRRWSASLLRSEKDTGDPSMARARHVLDANKRVGLIITKSLLSFSSGMTPPSKRNALTGQGNKGKQKRSRGSGSVGLNEDIFNPEGIFRQLLKSDSWKEVQDDMERMRVEQGEEQASMNAAARDAEQQRRKEPKVMTLDELKRQALRMVGCTKKESRELVNVSKKAQRYGGTLTFCKQFLSKVAARREKRVVKDTSGQVDGRRAREPQVAGSSSRSGQEAARRTLSNVQITDRDVSHSDLGDGNSDAGADSRYFDTDDEGVADTLASDGMIIMYTTQLQNAGLLSLDGDFLLPPRLMHEHDGDSTPTITTFAIPELNYNLDTGKGNLDFNKWHQVGFCSLANGQNPFFCDCNSHGACALKAANMERALAFSGAEQVLEGNCIHIDLLKSSVDGAHLDVIERCTLRSRDEEDSGDNFFELGTFQCRDKDMVLHQVCLNLVL